MACDFLAALYFKPFGAGSNAWPGVRPSASMAVSPALKSDVPCITGYTRLTLYYSEYITLPAPTHTLPRYSPIPGMKWCRTANKKLVRDEDEDDDVDRPTGAEPER